jgi:hypothetical protein
MNFYSFPRDGLQSAVLARRVVANVVAEYGVGTTVVVALTAYQVALGVYD